MSNIDYKSLPKDELRNMYYQAKKDLAAAENSLKSIRAKRDKLQEDIDDYYEKKDDKKAGYAEKWEAQQAASKASNEIDDVKKECNQALDAYNDKLHSFADVSHALKEHYSPLIKRIIDRERPEITHEEAYDLMDLYIPIAREYNYAYSEAKKIASKELPDSHADLQNIMANSELVKVYDKELRNALAVLQYADSLPDKKEEKDNII